MTSGVDPQQRVGAQVGIGTLIVFIAMVLVASIGAGVLLETAGVLQMASQDAGEDSTSLVADNLQVHSAVGNVTARNETVTVTVYNETHLALTGYEGPDYDYTETTVVVAEGQSVYLTSGDGNAADLIYGGLAVSFTGTELTTVNTANHARVRFEVLEGGDVRLYDDLENRAIGVVSSPVTMEASSGDILRYGTQMGQYDYSIGNESDTDPAYPSGSSYVLNHTEEHSREGPLDVIETVSLTVRSAPGSSAIDLRNVTVHYTSDRGATRLTYTAGEPSAIEFGTTPLTGSGTVLEETDQAIVELNATAIGDPTVSLQPGDTVRVQLVTEGGASTAVTLSVPSTLSGESEVEL